jgi:hypothetical protein
MGKAMENMVNEEGEIGSVVGGKTEGQPYHAYALPKKGRLRLAYSEVVYGFNDDGWEDQSGIDMDIEMAGPDRHVLHMSIHYTNEMGITSVLAGEDSGFLFCRKPETTSM